MSFFRLWLSGLVSLFFLLVSQRCFPLLNCLCVGQGKRSNLKPVSIPHVSSQKMLKSYQAHPQLSNKIHSLREMFQRRAEEPESAIALITGASAHEDSHKSANSQDEIPIARFLFMRWSRKFHKRDIYKAQKMSWRWTFSCIRQWKSTFLKLCQKYTLALPTPQLCDTLWLEVENQGNSSHNERLQLTPK